VIDGSGFGPFRRQPLVKPGLGFGSEPALHLARRAYYPSPSIKLIAVAAASSICKPYFAGSGFHTVATDFAQHGTDARSLSQTWRRLPRAGSRHRRKRGVQLHRAACVVAETTIQRGLRPARQLHHAGRQCLPRLAAGPSPQIASLGRARRQCRRSPSRRTGPSARPNVGFQASSHAAGQLSIRGSFHAKQYGLVCRVRSDMQRAVGAMYRLAWAARHASSVMDRVLRGSFGSKHEELGTHRISNASGNLISRLYPVFKKRAPPPKGGCPPPPPPQARESRANYITSTSSSSTRARCPLRWESIAQQRQLVARCPGSFQTWP